MIFKVVDPILQCLLIIAFVFCEDDGTCYGFFYTQILYALIGLQVLSSVANLFFDRNEFPILIRERIIYLVIIVPYMIYYHRQDFVDNAGVPFGFGVIPLIYSLLDTGLLVLAFWYNIVCFREVKMMTKSYDEE